MKGTRSVRFPLKRLGAAALAVCLAGCYPAAAPASVPSASVASLRGDSPQPALPGTELTEEEILLLAEQLLAQGQKLEEEAASPASWQLDKSDSFTEEVLGQSCAFYRVLTVQDRAELEQALWEVFSRSYTREVLGSLFRDDVASTLRERDGKLYASEEWFTRQFSPHQYTGELSLIGRAEDVISLQAVLSDESSHAQAEKTWPVTLRREDGRWVLDGWKTEMHSDNSFVALPQELARLAGGDQELAASLRYAWTLGNALRRGEQRWVDWCFSGLFEPASEQNPLQDISGLQVSDLAVEAGADGAVYLLLDVSDPGHTPLRAGRNWYLLTFGPSVDRGDYVTLQMYPDSELAAFGMGKSADSEQTALSGELTGVTGIFHNWACGGACEKDWWQSSADPLPAEIPYVAVRMDAEGRTDEGWFTAEQFEQAAREYLDEPEYAADPARLRQRCIEQDGRFALMSMGSLTTDLGLVCRDLGGGLAGGTATVVRRYYQDDLGLVPDYDLVYTLHRSLGGTGAWCVCGCEERPCPVESIS